MSRQQKRPLPAIDITTLLADKGADTHNLYRHALELIKLQGKLREAVPSPLASHITVAGLNDGTLSIHTTSAAWAARLRFKIPEMLKSVNEGETGSPVKSIRIKVKPASSPPVAARQRLSLSPENARLLQNVADSIPDPALRESLLRLSRNR